MYWIYLIIFILIILTPKIIQHGVAFLLEEDVESLLILFLGLFCFVLYLAKEKALLRAFKEKLHLQKQTNIITRDLSDSYSYIGEMNRRFDIVKDLIFNLPRNTAQALLKKNSDLYAPVIGAARLLAKTEQVALYFVNIRKKSAEKILGGNTFQSNLVFDAESLLKTKKFFWEEQGCVIIRSPKQALDTTAFLIFPKAVNAIEDKEVFKILASEALFLYCVEQGRISEQKT